MRIDAYMELGRRMRVWHCEEARPITHCVWVDDETNQYGVHDMVASNAAKDWILKTIQAKKIVIDIPALVIYINPHELPEESTDTCTSLSIENNSQSSTSIPA